MKAKIEISARHVHLCQEDLEKLFGENYELKNIKDLSQPGQFACEETVKIVGPKNSIEKVRVIGPCRPKTQVEISKTDGYFLGDVPPLRVSGNVIGSAPVTLVGPIGEVSLNQGLILAMRHVHMSEEQAEELELKDGQMISVKCSGERGLRFDNVAVRARRNFDLAFQIDTDEGNAAGVEKGDFGELEY